VKNAHEESISCTVFQALLMDYIDDELAPSERSAVLSHAAVCSVCRNSLKEIECVRKALTNLPQRAVTSEFDFRLKASIRLESRKLESPLYRFRLFLHENMAAMAVIPAAAAIMLASALIYPGISGRNQSVVNNSGANRLENSQTVSSAQYETRAEDVHYVLESVELSEVGLDSPHKTRTGDITPDTHTISLLSF